MLLEMPLSYLISNGAVAFLIQICCEWDGEVWNGKEIMLHEKEDINSKLAE